MMSTMMKTMLVAALATTGVSADGGKVLELDDSNFDSTVAENPTTLVEFFAPWCGHCKALAPEYAKAAEELEGKNAGKLASVDCTEHKELCNKYGVRGFPTLKLFRNDGSEPSDYDQARKADALVKFMVKQNSPAVQEVTDVASFAPGEAVRVVAFVDADTDLAEYTKVAQALRNEYNFGVVRGNAEAAAAAKVTVPGVAVLRNFDEGDVAFSGAAFGGASFGEELTSFIKAQSFPLVGEIGPENYSKYLDRGFPFVWLFVDKSSDEQTRFVNDVAAVVAKDFRDSLSFVKLDGIKWAEHAKSFGLPGTTPGIAIEDRGRRKNYLFPEGAQLAIADFGEFVRGYAAGTLAANVKSEPVPESNDAPVTVVVGKTFDKIVLDEAKDVLVEFYAPWCGHCKSLAPKYDELGAKYAGDDNVVIAKIDATANDHPADVQGFPTILFYPAGSDKTAVEFNGARTVDSMAEFIENNRKSSPGAAKKAAAAAEHGADHADL